MSRTGARFSSKSHTYRTPHFITQTPYTPENPTNLLSDTHCEAHGVHYNQSDKTLIWGADHKPLLKVVTKTRMKCLVTDISPSTEHQPNVHQAIKYTQLMSRMAPSLEIMHERLYYARKDRILRACGEADMIFSSHGREGDRKECWSRS